jgi:ABC-type Fe3+ transport system permease subunit
VCACVCLCVLVCVLVCACLCLLVWSRQIKGNQGKSGIGIRGNHRKSGILDFPDSPGSRVSFCVFVCGCVCLCVLVCACLCLFVCAFLVKANYMKSCKIKDWDEGKSGKIRDP